MRPPRRHSRTLLRLPVALGAALAVFFSASPALAGLRLGGAQVSTPSVAAAPTAGALGSTVVNVTQPLTGAVSAAPSATDRSQQPPSLTAPVASAVESVAPAVGRTVETATQAAAAATAPVAAAAPVLGTVQNTAAPAVRTVDATVAPLVGTVSETAAPLVGTVEDATPLGPTVAQVLTTTTGTVTEVAQPVAGALPETTEAARGLAAGNARPQYRPKGRAEDRAEDRTGERTPGATATALEGSLVGTAQAMPGGPGVDASTPSPAPPAATSEPSLRREAPAANRTHPRDAATREQAASGMLPVLLPAGSEALSQAPEDDAPAASARPARAPSPWTSDGVFGGVLPAFGSGAGGAAPLLLLAILTSLALLTAPRPGRRLRPVSLPRPPSPHPLSLEHPG